MGAADAGGFLMPWLLLAAAMVFISFASTGLFGSLLFIGRRGMSGFVFGSTSSIVFCLMDLAAGMPPLAFVSLDMSVRLVAIIT